MAATAEQLLVRIEATTESLRREMRRAEQTVGSSSKKMVNEAQKIDRGFSKLDRTFQTLRRSLGALGLGLSVRGLQQFATSAINAADAVGKTADRIGLNVEALQELRHAAQLAGVQQNTLDMAMQRFTRRVAEAAQGSGELKGTLEQYGIAVRDANGRTRDTEAVLADLADAMQGADSDAERLRIAFKAFDSEGAALVNMLRNGSAALNDTRQEARDLGLVLGRDLTDAAADFNDEMARLNSVIGANLAQGMLRTLAAQSTSFAEVYKDPLLHEGLQRVGSLIIGIGREALATATTLGALVEVFRSGDLDALSEVGLLGVARRMVENFGLLGEEADNATGPVSNLGTAMQGLMDDAAGGLASVQEMLAGLDGKGGKGGAGGGGGGGMADRVGNVVAALEQQNERLRLMKQAMGEGQEAVEGLNVAFQVYDELLAAGIIPNTMSLQEAMMLTAEGANEEARAIGMLVKENERLEKAIDGRREADEKAMRAANDNERQAEEQMRQQAARFVRVAPETIEAAQQDFDALFGEVVA